jgi:hypothetical protein
MFTLSRSALAGELALGIFLLLSLILCDALASFKSNTLDCLNIPLQDLGYIFHREILCHLPFQLLELSTVLLLTKKPAF